MCHAIEVLPWPSLAWKTKPPLAHGEIIVALWKMAHRSIEHAHWIFCDQRRAGVSWEYACSRHNQYRHSTDDTYGGENAHRRPRHARHKSAFSAHYASLMMNRGYRSAHRLMKLSMLVIITDLSPIIISPRMPKRLFSEKMIINAQK